MSGVDKFISKVETEATTIRITGISPNLKEEQSSLKRLSEKNPELDIDMEDETTILKHARLSPGAKKN